MRVYNFPSDEIHIKNNKGEELAKIGPDGVEIDGTSFPVVSVEDAGKTLVVNDEGKIVAGEAGGTVVTVNVALDTEAVEAAYIVTSISMYADEIAAVADKGISFYIVTDESLGNARFVNSSCFIGLTEDNPPATNVIVSGVFKLGDISAEYSLLITSNNAIFSLES